MRDDLTVKPGPGWVTYGDLLKAKQKACDALAQANDRIAALEAENQAVMLCLRRSVKKAVPQASESDIKMGIERALVVAREAISRDTEAPYWCPHCDQPDCDSANGKCTNCGKPVRDKGAK